MELHIDPELKEFITPLKEDEFEGLTIDLKANGCIEPIIVWNGGGKTPDTIVDGHHRYRICQEYNIPFKTARIKFADKLAAMNWMYNKQKGRRNLSIVERLELFAKLKEYASKYAKERMLAGKKVEEIANDRITSREARFNKKGKTLAKVAEKAGVSRATAERYDTIQRKGTDEQKEALRSGQKKIGTVYKEIQAKKKPAEKTQSNECDIEKLLKGKIIKTPYLLLYSKQDEETGEEMRAYLSNCELKANLHACRDFMMESTYGKCHEDDFVQGRISIRRMIDGVVFEEVKTSVSSIESDRSFEQS